MPIQRQHLVLILTALVMATPALAQRERVERPLPVRRDSAITVAPAVDSAPTAGVAVSTPAAVPAPESARPRVPVRVPPSAAATPLPAPSRSVKVPTNAPRVVALTTPQSAVGLRGRYRVVLTGMIVNRQSFDNPLQLDGKGDEIFIAAATMLYDGQTKEVLQDLKRTAVLGDANGHPAFIQAGRASPQGGLLSGNRVPDVANPWSRNGDATGDRLPLLLWEGELEQGRHALVISPAPWEWDAEGAFFDQWRINREERVREWAATDLAPSVLMHAFVKPIDLPTSTLLRLNTTLGEAADRPIGLREMTAADVAAATAPAPPPPPVGATPVPPVVGAVFGMAKYALGLTVLPQKLAAAMKGTLVFHEQLVVLTPFTIEQALANPAKAGARLPGIIEIRYTDAPQLQGSYTLFLQVERLP